MADALQRRGLHGVGLNEILRDAQAPKGVLYHHFPGGKTELAVAAIQAIVARIVASLDQVLATTTDPATAFERWVQGAQRHLAASSFERGCPLATVALESASDDVAIRGALALAFATIRERIGQALQVSGVPTQQAQGLAALMLAAYEGGLLQARVAGDAEPMARATGMLLTLIQTTQAHRTHP
ncbi:MAG: TetR/AcrR family transcriptional regulator [Rhodoferax sp.]|nr:TetR/AcrR family transcriptional regulator [Rhodoferax sp.]